MNAPLAAAATVDKTKQPAPPTTIRDNQQQSVELSPVRRRLIEFADSLIVATIGTIFSTAITGIAFGTMCNWHTSLGAMDLADLAVAFATTAAFFYLGCYSCPIWLGAILLVLQLLSGATVGQLAIDSMLVYGAIDPENVQIIELASIILTFVFIVFPAFSRPLYKVLLWRSPLRDTIGTRLSGASLVTANGGTPCIRQLLKRELLESFGFLLHHWSIFRGSNFLRYDDWLSHQTDTLLVEGPRRLANETIVAKDKITVRYRAFAQLTKTLDAIENRKSNVRVVGTTITPLLRGFSLIKAQGVIFLTLVSFAVLRTVDTFGLHSAKIVESPDVAPGLYTFLKYCWFLFETKASTPLIQTIDIALLANLSVLSAIVFFRPTDVEFNKEGLRLIGRNMLLAFQDPVLPWTKVKRIGLEVPKNKVSIADHWLVFYAEDGTRKRLRIGNIDSIAAREEILSAIERWAPSIPRDPKVITMLQSPCDYSYTEIWLEGLSAPPQRERLEPLREGALLKNEQYHVEKMLGCGGQGTAYQCVDTLTNTTAVLKEFMLPIFVDVNVRRRALSNFEQEARLLKELAHPNVVKLLDYFVEDHRAYLVLEHIDGKSLQQIVKEHGSLSQAEVVPLAMQMCDILSYLSSRKTPIVHRDFTPDNLILGKDGVLKLIDFNVAHEQTADGSTGTVVGKAPYMAPEQFRGATSVLSDLYSMGASLHYLLTSVEPTPISASDPLTEGADVSADLNLLVHELTQPEVSRRLSCTEKARETLTRM